MSKELSLGTQAGRGGVQPRAAQEIDALMAQAEATLRSTFGFAEFRSHQRAIVATLLAGRDAFVLMPTGGGKSLCYQIPSLVREGTGVVVSPLIALMHDQVNALREIGVNAAYLNSSLDWHAQAEVERALRAGVLDLLYVAPERLVQNRLLDLLATVPVALFAIDEAHCVSAWGHDFRPEYRQLRILPERFPRVPRVALTASADERTRTEIVRELALERAEIFRASFDRPNICYRVSEIDGASARERLWRFLAREHPTDAGIVYCLTRRAVEETAAWLTAKGRTALPYHAGLDAVVRREVQQRFQAEDGLIVVATIAFGMGIDKPDVRFVAHLNLPKSIEAYYQETGRAGRDGERASAWMAYAIGDIVQHRQWIDQSEAGEEHRRVQRGKLDALVALAETAGCRRQALLAYFGEYLPEPCGHCDNCLEPPEAIDATVLAKKALSAVYRTGQRFGFGYVIDVLRGKDDERIVRNGHHRLSVFGIGRDVSQAEWRALLRQLVAAGHLAVEPDGHGGLVLTESARPLLRGEVGFKLRKPKAESKPKSNTLGREHTRDRARSSTVALEPAHEPAFKALRTVRAEIARAQGVPPFVICHDRTLLDMVRLHPRNLEELRLVHGMGTVKVERYGEAFLAALAAIDRRP